MKKPNKNMHSDKIKLRSFLTALYFAGDVKRWAMNILAFMTSSPGSAEKIPKQEHVQGK